MRIIRNILCHWKSYVYNIYLQVIVRLQVIIEMIGKNLLEESRHLLRFRKMPVFPYDFPDKYHAEEVEVYRDNEEFPYVWHKGKRLYMKQYWSDQRCKKYYLSLLIEQDDKSPHKYLTNIARLPSSEDIVADVGAAEGVFALDIIERVRKVYLFEGDVEWKRPLEKTFSAWKDKTELVDKYIADKDDVHGAICFDSFFREENVTYVKADIEGWEEKMLIGGADVFCHQVKKILITTYHIPHAEDILENYLERYGFECEFNNGYCLYIYNKDTFKKPYVRRCVLFGWKNENI